MITFDLPPIPKNTHLISSDFNQFLDDANHCHFGAKLAGQAIASTLMNNGAHSEDLDKFADTLIAQHTRGYNFFAPLSEWPALSESFKEGFQRVIDARHEQQGVIV